MQFTSFIYNFSNIVLGIIAAPNLGRGNSDQIAHNFNCNSPQTTWEMTACAEQNYEKADRKLNEVYRQLKLLLGASQQKRLINR